MPRFSPLSKKRLRECDPRLQTVFNSLIKEVDCNVECGHRGEAEQNLAHMTGASTKKWPESKHNASPSKAIDSFPFVNGKRSDDPRVCRFFAGRVIERALDLGIKLIWGGDWDGDMDPTDQKFNDLVHFELKE